ncbi:cytochrome P450 CYP72A219-like protein [Tanacetum coccineum]
MNIHHDRELWGEHATEFKPQRFSEGVANAIEDKGSSSFLPFNGGPGFCIGQNFAMIEAKTAIAKILQWKWFWEVLNWVWLKPKKLEKWLRDQGYKGNSYKLLIGDMGELARMVKEAKSSQIPITHDITSHCLPFDNHILTKYGKMSFMWFGPIPRIYITEPELIKEILSRPNEFQKPHPDHIRDSIIAGLLVSEGDKWIKHRQIINPAFHIENIKAMFSAICSSCNDMINKWELSTNGTSSVEVDVWPYIDNLAGDVISRTAFGSCYEEGKKIFNIQKEQIDLILQLLFIVYIPGGRFLPTRANKKFKANRNELQILLRGIIEKRKKAIEMGEDSSDDLLGILLKSNFKEIKEDEEFLHQEWQTKAREEIIQIFGTRDIHFDGLKHLKIMSMILNEVLRLYPPAVMMLRASTRETKLGNMMIPAGVHIYIPTMYVHHDREIWGEDATEFKPERFSQGVANATKLKGSSSFVPFAGGPRVCIGQNFAMIEAKVAIGKILQRFSFELAPSYEHSPFPSFTLPPQSGAKLILRNM